MNSLDIYEVKKNILKFSKKAFEEKLIVGTSGNISIFIPEKEIIAITPSGIRYETMDINDIVLINLKGEKVEENKNKPSSEFLMHLEIYKNRKDIKSIIHTHSIYATSFAVANKDIPIILIEMAHFLGDKIRCCDIEIPGTRGVGIGALKSLNKAHGCLLKNHGVVAIGSNIEKAYIRAEYIEESAKIFTFSKIIGEPNEIEEEILKQISKSDV